MSTGKLLKAKVEKGKKTTNCKHLCRLCMIKCNDADSINIYDTSTDTTISSRIFLCTGLQITHNDSLPQKICYECRYQLEKSFLFRNKSKNSDSKLHRHVWLINSGKDSDILDDSEDEFEGQYDESNNIIAELDRHRGGGNKIESTKEFKRALNEAVEQERQRILQDEMDRIYVEAKQNVDEQMESERVKVKPQNTRKSTRNIKKDHHQPAPPPPSDDFLMSYNDNDEEFIEEDETVMDTGDAQDLNDSPNEIYLVDSDLDFEIAKTEPQSPSASQSYMVLESGDIALAEDVDFYQGDGQSDDDSQTDDPQNEEYLEEEFEEDTTEQYEELLPTIKKTVAARAKLQLDDNTKYKFSKKPGKIIEIQCTTSDGNVVYVEMEDNRTMATKSFPVDENGEFKIFHCDQCPATFSRRQQLLGHASEHKEKFRGMKCSYCQKWFPSNSTLKRHIRIHTGEKPFQCDVCGRSFIQKEILKRHVMIHTGERPNKCSFCPKTFILKETLRQHINRNHMETPVISVHKCMICPKTFCHSSGLSRHLLVHAGRTFDCESCAKKFNDRSALKRHIYTIHKKQATSTKNECPSPI